MDGISISQRLLVTCASLLLGATAHAGDARTEFPYRAAVAAPTLEVFAGPGPHYYATAELPKGAEVEVYEHTSNGLCAIRPPQGSFSWLPASAVQRLGDGLAEVTRGGAPARVGSLLHERRDAVHVRLDVGERVRVLSEVDLGGVAWLQIAPPAGEFRWVERARLAPVSNDVPAQGDAIKTPPAKEIVVTADAAPSATASRVQAAAHSQPAAPVPPVEPPQAGSGIKVPTPAAAQLDDSMSVAQRVNAIEIALARQIAELPTLWRLEGLEQQTSALMAQATSDADRAAVRDLATRLDHFAAVSNRYKTQRGTAPNVRPMVARTPHLSAPGVGQPSYGPPSYGAPITPIGAAAPTPGDSGYDAVGVLRPVVSKRPNAPGYALVDPAGQIVSFVSAGPSVNLQSLVGQRVGLSGARGYMPEYRQPHLTARRAASLDTTRR